MAPLTLLAAQKVANLLTTGDVLSNEIQSLSSANNIIVPPISTSQVILSSVDPNLGDDNVQLTYPRICIYPWTVKNTKAEKFRSFSGTVAVVAEIWASGNLVQQIDEWIHFYVEAYTLLLRENTGDWKDGMFFSGIYDVQFQSPKAGGLGFVESAKVTCVLNVSLN
ncbi:MAG TPA: hypothetical protein VF283_22630 [Bryobacteraceae bacterium]